MTPIPLHPRAALRTPRTTGCSAWACSCPLVQPVDLLVEALVGCLSLVPRRDDGGAPWAGGQVEIFLQTLNLQVGLSDQGDCPEGGVCSRPARVLLAGALVLAALVVEAGLVDCWVVLVDA